MADCIIECDKAYFRPLEVDTLLGNPKKAKKLLNWLRREARLEGTEMVDFELNLVNPSINFNSKIYVAGHRGLVGSAIVRKC